MSVKTIQKYFWNHTQNDWFIFSYYKMLSWFKNSLWDKTNKHFHWHKNIQHARSSQIKNSLVLEQTPEIFGNVWIYTVLSEMVFQPLRLSSTTTRKLFKHRCPQCPQCPCPPWSCFENASQWKKLLPAGTSGEMFCGQMRQKLSVLATVRRSMFGGGKTRTQRLSSMMVVASCCGTGASSRMEETTNNLPLSLLTSPQISHWKVETWF